MKFFNIDLHISVIADLKKIFTELGHSVTDRCLSGHADVIGRKQDYYKELSSDKWTWYIYNWEFDSFYPNHKDELDQYDAFIVTYPPVFSMLYEKTNKPIIVHIPIRYDYGMHGRPDLLKKYNDAMWQGVKEGRIFFSANNLYDKWYFKSFNNLCPCEYIPSYCDYTGIGYSGSEGPALVYSPERKSAEYLGGVWRHDLPRGYKWNELTKYRAIVHVPYEVSTMSVFEQYAANIPLLFPTKKCLMDMYFGGWKGVLNQTSLFKLYNKEPKSLAPYTCDIDPNNYKSHETVKQWIDCADYYNIPHILYYDTFDDAKAMLQNIDLLRYVSKQMQEENRIRKLLIYSKWGSRIDEISRFLS